MGENQDSMQLSEELQFVTACLIGHYVKVQTTSIFLKGTLKAASFDKDYGIVLYVGSENEVHQANVKLFLRDIAYISAEDLSLDLNKDAILKSCTKVNHSKVVKCIPAGQFGENTKATQQHATNFSSSTNVVSDQKLCRPSGESTNATILNATSVASSTIIGVDQTPIMPIMQPAQIDNSFQGVQINSQPVSFSYQPPINDYGLQWQYPNAGGQLVTYVPPPYPQAAQPMKGYVPPPYPQIAQPVQGYVPHEVQGYVQYPPRSQNFDPLYQFPRGHQGPR